MIRTLPAKTKFITLDEQERELDENDLMICNSEEDVHAGGVRRAALGSHGTNPGRVLESAT